MKIAIEGCAHGELENIYATLQGIEEKENIKISLLICCGDFQSTRNLEDLETMAVPRKYLEMGTFYKYYSGELIAPMLTIFIGGNHEASNYLQELPYGGWVAPNIYYLGYAGVVRINGLRIGGLSGIYKGVDFLRGRHEYPPYTESTKRSVYHQRQLEVFRLKQLSGIVDIFLSHDWPRGIYNYGNKAQLLKFKRHFENDIESGQMGSRPCEELLKTLKPMWWFAAHMHCQFSAIVPHEEISDDPIAPEQERVTKFLALDKCLPKRRFLQVLDFDTPDYLDDNELHFEYDLEWLSILYLTNHLLSVKNGNYYMPGPQGNVNGERHNYTPTAEELEHVRQKLASNLRIPKNFCRTVEPFNPCADNDSNTYVSQPKAQINPQTMQFNDTLGIDDPLSLAMVISGHELSYSSTLDGSEGHLNDSSSLLLGDQSSINSSSCADISTPSPLKRKTSLGLSLPEPIMEDAMPSSPIVESSVNLNMSTNPDELHLQDSSADEAEKSIDNAQGAEQDINSEHKDKDSFPNSALNEKPPIKKFKRRNQELYKENDSENDDCT